MEIMGFSVRDEVLTVVVPLVVYWLYSALLMLLPARTLEKYRLHSKKDEDDKNLVSKGTVIKGVLLYQATQMVIFITVFMVTGSDADAYSNRKDSLISLVKQFFIAILVYDTWQYFVHRLLHQNKFLYRHVHSQHHQLLVPYAYGAMYFHPVEGILNDGISGALSMYLSDMSPRASIFFFTITSIKVVSDHCGLLLPWDIFNIFLENSTVFHDSHHQLYATKYNFSAPYLVIWDKIFGTYMPHSVVKKVGGGFEARPTKDFKNN